MFFRRTSQSSARHRRVLYDTLSGAYVLGVTTPSQRRGRSRRSPYAGKSQNYGDATFLEVQARVTDLVPLHPLVLLALFVAGLGCVAGLLGLYVWMLRSGPAVGYLAALDLGARGSLGTWFASATLALAALVALVVYCVRRYKLEDYHGHYRVWLWAAACWLLLSIDATANIHEAFGQLMVLISGTRLFGESSIWWLIVGGFFVGGVGTRLLVDMRHCWLSAAALTTTGICWAVCIGSHYHWIGAGNFEWPEVDFAARCVVFNRGAFLAGSFLILMSMVWHARHVILDAEGLLPRRRYSRRAYTRGIAASLAEEQAAIEGVGTVTVLPPHRVARPTVVTPVVTQSMVTPVVTTGSTGQVRAIASAVPVQTASGDVAMPVQRTLTKHEKKALRVRLEKAREDRERRAG
jgi:hypothetical protein